MGTDIQLEPASNCGLHRCQAFPANTLIAFQRLHSLTFVSVPFADAKDRASSTLDNLFGKALHQFMIVYVG